ncbi:hypothetical protein BBK36DRAFT_1163660 [Trichoderma citrinoviride]|uniref:Uncharacterized protein n=1 Tax=Trichoderma citrinoviride TaxID=58853 RepID=A0A2T4AXB4_9HYPO|nr:hypothetical protein BBK36DRAFT_1163660 [Trichoderma citrinoviride]PTB61720.1 hypothetical protein BBK36DRAFT_1163660 [Trichoderma citrinoviride]
MPRRSGKQPAHVASPSPGEDPGPFSAGQVPQYMGTRSAGAAYTPIVNLPGAHEEDPGEGPAPAADLFDSNAPYTAYDFGKDAAFLLFAQDEIDAGHFVHLKPFLSQAALSAARAVSRMTSDKDRQVWDAAFTRDLHNRLSPLNQAARFAEVVRRFMEDPVVEASASRTPPAPTPPAPSPSPSSARRPESPTRPAENPAPVWPWPPYGQYTGTTYPPFYLHPQYGYPGLHAPPPAPHQDPYGPPAPTPPAPAPTGPYTGDDVRRQPRFGDSGGFRPRSWNDPVGDPDDHSARRRLGYGDTRTRSSRDPGDYPRTSYNNLPVSTFALDTTKTPIRAYISTLQFLRKKHGDSAILERLVPGLMSAPTSNGAEWFQSLDARSKELLIDDLDLWITMLDQRFRDDRGAILVKADELKHSFAAEDSLPLQTYMDRKIAYYTEAGDVDEDTVARRLVMDADPALAKLVDVNSGRNTITDVRRQLTMREFAARRDWKLAHEQSVVTANQISQLTRQMKELRDSAYNSRNRRSDAGRGDKGYNNDEDNRPRNRDKDNRRDNRDNRGNQNNRGDSHAGNKSGRQDDKYRDSRTGNAKSGQDRPRPRSDQKDGFKINQPAQPTAVKAFPTTVSFAETTDNPPQDPMDLDDNRSAGSAADSDDGSMQSGFSAGSSSN